LKDDDDDGQDEVYDNEQKANNDRKLQTNFACQTQQTNGMKGIGAERERERKRERGVDCPKETAIAMLWAHC